MVRFSCFQAHAHSIKPKKTVQPSIEATAKTLTSNSLHQPSTESSIRTSSHQLLMEALEDKQMNNSKNLGSNLASVECGWSSEDLKSKFVNECDREVRHAGRLKRSQSLKSGLYQEGKHYTCNLTDGETDPGFSSNGSKSYTESIMPGCKKDQEANLTDQSKKNSESEVHVSSALGNNGSIFSIGDPTPLDKDAHENSDTPLSGECAGDFADHTPGLGTPTRMVKSSSLPNIRASTPSSGKCSLKHVSAVSQSRSSEDLHVIGMRQKVIGKTEETQMDSCYDDGYDSYKLSGLAKDWVVPVVDDINAVKILQGESSAHHLHELPHNDFKIKRIEDWVIDLQHCGPLEETHELSESIDRLNEDVNISGVTSARVDSKVIPGMEAAKRYISSLGANATAAQLANHGLAVIPFLSAFASLKVLNLSGNTIVRITAGALPRGLHILNLSKNNISAIEGLRELTRLRVLDLSYNRIFRIGHGLASCSSLKELYLAGNKISEVEGLHRLLKLSVLDLRFNKISTAKCLGQLAANYNSLQAISLEGNPAQKNVGDEQLKKYLQGLLPRLIYYNRQPMKANTLKDAADRSVRLGISSHQFDRNLRSDHKTTRKGSHGVAARRPTASATHARRSQTVVSPKRPKGKQGRLPQSGTKVSTQNRHYFDFGSKLLNFGSDLSNIRRSRSEGTMGAL